MLAPAYDAPDFSQVAAVIAVPFNSYVRGEKPDRTNQAIADIAASMCTARQLPFFGQWEQTDILRSNGVGRIHEHQSSGKWIQTHVLTKWMAQTINAYELRNNVALIAHPHHARRAAALARFYGLTVTVPWTCGNIPYDPSDRTGAQWWTTSATRYIPWEYASRAALIALTLTGKL